MTVELLDRRQREIVVDRRGNRFDLDARFDSEPVVIGVKGLGNQYFIAFTEADRHRHEDGFGSPVGNQQVFITQFDPHTLVIPDQLAPVSLQTGRMAIRKNLIVDIFDRIDRHLRGGNVGLPDIQVIDFDPMARSLFGIRYQFADRRRWQGKTFVGQAGHIGEFYFDKAIKRFLL